MRNAILDLLYPHAAQCLLCGDPRGASGKDCLCDACRVALEGVRVPAASCDRCLSLVPGGEACPFCHAGVMKHIVRTYAPYMYAGPARKLVQCVKFRAEDEALFTLCNAMADTLPRRDFDFITPVPLHYLRKRERGVNQAALLANGLQARTGIPVREDVLVRLRATKPQSTLNRARRRENVSGAFAAKCVPAGASILLVDDVRTTGHTADACAQVLLEAGAKEVSLCVACVVHTYRKSGGKGEK